MLCVQQENKEEKECVANEREKNIGTELMGTEWNGHEGGTAIGTKV